jgi:tRNA A-37 threonylcarbamoyl transferase component Bud32
MGVVFRARHAVIERPLAIKVLKRDAMRDTATVRRFVQEAKAASRIGHPNIVDVTDFGTTPDGMTYSVMEYVEGQTLGAALRHDAPFAPTRAIRITAQIARALAAAHDKGIVHRDLKPENVFLLDRDGRQDFVKIVDFGIAKVTPPSGQAAEPRLTRAGSVFGTPEYMAPEQAAGRGDTDGRVDIYALGVILYEMICGRVPHRSDSLVRTLAMQMLDPIVPPSKVRPDLAIPPELEAIVMQALAKKREQRYQAMGELLQALEAGLPPVVGRSVTGSPMYMLPALPPGADPNTVPAMPAMPLPPTQPGLLPGEANPTATRRAGHEPEFTTGEQPMAPPQGFTEAPLPAPRRHWPRRLLLLGLVAGGTATAAGLVIKNRHAAVSDIRNDAGLVALTGDARPDSGPVDAPPTAPPTDATDLVVVPTLDAGRLVRSPGARDASVPALPTGPTGPTGPATPGIPNHRGMVGVQILTKPEGASLYDNDQHYRGTGGAQVEEPFGTRRTFTCKQSGYKPGTVEVAFDSTHPTAVCVLTRIKVCINVLKNPFDDCEPDPGAPNGPSGPSGSGTPGAPSESP